MSSPMPPLPGAMPSPMPDLSGLAAGQPTSSAGGGDQSAQFMQLAKQLDDMASAIASAHPQFAKAAEAIKKAIQEGTMAVIAEQKETQSNSPAAGMAYGM